MCELARNSCLQSGFEMEVKRHWLGHDWYKPGVEGNQIHKTNVPSLRVEYRHETLNTEIEMVSCYPLFNLLSVVLIDFDQISKGSIPIKSNGTNLHPSSTVSSAEVGAAAMSDSDHNLSVLYLFSSFDDFQSQSKHSLTMFFIYFLDQFLVFDQ